ncbi:zinc finger CCCH domain-containing protein 64 isoform X1 [Aristolochia californica]|uniref:zinc finger CCCH domain-containing protein 64 isoform X1 n=1 Tax=Aristolochia californica TaxID=171875 RepID=UPI0035DAF6F8
MVAPRFLFCGDVLGRLNQLFKRVAAVNKSAGPFDALLCVGQFFPDSPELQGEFLDYLEGGSSFPLPTYFIGDYGLGAAKVLSAVSRDPSNLGFKTDGLRICENLFWLKGSGKFFLHGVSVMYLSGKHSSDSQIIGTYSEDDVDALRALADEHGVIDIFLTNEWPSGVTARADVSNGPPGLTDSSSTNPKIAQLAAEIKPRYHFAGAKGVFYARDPYINEGAVHVTRFLGLAPVGNKDKQKFIHAISPTPASTMSAAEISLKPPNSTMSPYIAFEQTAPATEFLKQSQHSTLESQYWRFDASQKRQQQGGPDGERLCFKFTSTGSCQREGKCNFRHDSDARDHFRKGCCFDFLNKGKCEKSECSFSHSLEEEDGEYSRKRQRLSSRDAPHGRSCWFCLSSPNIETHLVVSIGESCYCALAKGQLVEDHVLVIPVEHCPNVVSLTQEAAKELQRYKSALRNYFKKQGKAVVYYEYLPSSHGNLQVIPIPKHKAADVCGRFLSAAKKFGVEFEVINPSSDDDVDVRKLSESLSGKSNFFYVELPEGTILSLAVGEKEKFPVQFGREVLADLLNIKERADWRNSKLSKEDETKIAEDFKKRFEEFDPSK